MSTVCPDGWDPESEDVKVHVNDVFIDAIVADQYGLFDFERNFDPTDHKLTYVLKAVYGGGLTLLIRYATGLCFSGDSNVKNVTAWSYTLNGTRYAACTTMQYNDYKPSANSTTLTGAPRASNLLTEKLSEKSAKAENRV